MLNRSKVQDCDLPQAWGGGEVGGPAEAVVEEDEGEDGGGDDDGGEEVCAAVHVIGVYGNQFVLDLSMFTLHCYNFCSFLMFFL